MKNIDLKNNQLFNEDIKRRFLNEVVSKNTSISYERIFIITSHYENVLNKDLNKFSINEIESILYDFKSSSRNTIESYGRIMSSYLNWSVKNGLTSYNVLSTFTPRDFEKYIYDDFIYLKKDDMKYLENACVNYQDAVILRLLFIGVGGKNVSEIRNLKKSDINHSDKTLSLKESLKNGVIDRIISVDSYTLNLIEGALNQRIYMKKNGEAEVNDNIRPYTDLVSNDYVIRASITRTDSVSSEVDKFVIYRRLSMLSDTIGLGKPLNVKNIQKSGMLNYASELTNKGSRSVSLDDLKMIAHRFNVKSHHNLKGFINDENIIKYLEV